MWASLFLLGLAVRLRILSTHRGKVFDAGSESTRLDLSKGSCRSPHPGEGRDARGPPGRHFALREGSFSFQRMPHFYSRSVASALTLCDWMRGGSAGKRNAHSRPRSVGGGRSPRYEERRAAQHGGRSSSSSSYAPEWSDAAAIAVMQQLQEGRRAAGERISAHVRRVSTLLVIQSSWRTPIPNTCKVPWI